VQTRDLALHVAEAALHVRIPLVIDAARHLVRLQLHVQFFILGLQRPDARIRRQGAAHRIHDAKTGIVAADFERRVQDARRQ
jgi:hypothetical protein